MTRGGGLFPGGLPRSWREISSVFWSSLCGAHGALRLPILALVRFYADQAPIRAAALTYTTLLSIVPVLAFSFAILRGLGFDQGIYKYIIEQLGPVFNSDVREQLFAFIGKVNFKTLGATGLGVFLLSVILTLNTVERSLNVIFDVKEDRPLSRKFTDYFSMIFFTPLLLGIILSSTALFKIRGFVASLGSYWFLTTGAELLLKLVPLAGSIILITLMLIVLPNARIRFVPGLTGGAVGGVLMFFLQWGYVSFQVGFAGKMAIYGHLAQLPILMVWIYLSWCILFYAAGLSALVQGVPDKTGARGAAAGGWGPALMVVASLASRAATREPLLTLEGLEKKLDYPGEILIDIINRLKESGLVAETGEGKQLLTARNPAAIAAIEIFDAAEDAPHTGAGGEYARAGALLGESHKKRRQALEGVTLDMLLDGNDRAGSAGHMPAAEASAEG